MVFVTAQTLHVYVCSRQAQAALELEYEVLCNGDLAVPDTIVHHCFPGAPCGCKNHQETVQRLVWMFRRSAFRRRLPKPSLDEFTNVRAAAKNLAFSVVNNKLGPSVWSIAVSNIPARQGGWLCDNGNGTDQ